MSWDGKVYGKYAITHADGTPLHGKEYFVLRLDSDDPAEAARVKAAMAAYKGEACPEGDATETPEPPKGGEMCGDSRFELIESAKKELLRCTNIEGSPDEMAVLDSLLFRMWQMRWLPGCRRHDGASEVACNVDHVDIDHVLKIGRDFQAQDRWRGTQFDTAKLLCDTIEALRARLAEAGWPPGDYPKNWDGSPKVTS